MTKTDVPELPKNGTVMHTSVHFAVGTSGRNFTEHEIFPYCSVETPDDSTKQPKHQPWRTVLLDSTQLRSAFFNHSSALNNSSLLRRNQLVTNPAPADFSGHGGDQEINCIQVGDPDA